MWSDVSATYVETDQIGENAEFAISGQARTLGGATWETDSCWRADGLKRCGEVIMPGSLLPLTGG